jgi:hypothetical protein
MSASIHRRALPLHPAAPSLCPLISPGGFGAAPAIATATGTAAGRSGAAATTPLMTPAGTVGGGGAAAAAATLDPLTELPQPEDSRLEFAAELPEDLMLLNNLTQTQTQDQEQQEEQPPQHQHQHQQPRRREPGASEGQPAASLLPLPSVGELPEHYMPLSPVHEGKCTPGAGERGRHAQHANHRRRERNTCQTLYIWAVNSRARETAAPSQAMQSDRQRQEGRGPRPRGYGTDIFRMPTGTQTTRG